MKSACFCLFFLVGVVGAYAQVLAPVDPGKNASLKERYNYLKATSQTFREEYKVIREVQLDGVWAIAEDSIKAVRQQSMTATVKLKKLELEKKQTLADIQAKEAKASEMIYDSTHISFLGISFHKALFVLLVLAFTGALGAACVLIYLRLRMISSNLAEQKVIVKDISNEFDEFKKKSMEKQTKLSRELQNERNRVQELSRLL